MITVAECDEQTIRRIADALRKIALGRTVSFVIEEGHHRILDQGDVFTTPNGTFTCRLFVNGGAKDSGDAVPHPAVASDVA